MAPKVKIAAHKGICCGNIPGNTLDAFDLAIRQGADIIELDATMSAEGTLFVFHPGTEDVVLRENCDLRTLTDTQIRQKRLVNVCGISTGYGIVPLRDALHHLRDRCVINIDKFQDNPAAIARLVREMKMQDQVIVKTNSRPELFQLVAECAGDLPYMPFVYHTDEYADHLAQRRDLRYRGAEIIFSAETDEVATDAYIRKMHARGLELWVNAIIFDEKRQLVAGHSDDMSMLHDPDHGWGWLIRKGFDIIQTDWPLPLRQYMNRI